MTATFDFDADFEALTGYAPFPWQRRLFSEQLACSKLPASVDIPTGLGKTAVMAIWLLARASIGLLEQSRNEPLGRTEHPPLPRRLVYVVDRRVVVDQATEYAEQIRTRLTDPTLEPVRRGLGLDDDRSLPISTLRGQHVDNREWMEDPSTPAIVIGTVDMIGSRLLFEGYGISRKMRPFVAGLMGCDTLIVLDEAHLVPPFEKLLEDIEAGVDRWGPSTKEDREIVPPFKLLALSATRRDTTTKKTGIFQLRIEDCTGETSTRLGARKQLTIDNVCDENKFVSELVERSWRLSTKSGSARVLVYCNHRKDAQEVKDQLDKRLSKDKCPGKTALLVGARRVLEREELSKQLKELGFLGDVGRSPEHPAFLVATSAGEVGVDLDADHMVCDLVEWERMVQRLGRVNRRGKGDACIEVVAAPRKSKQKVKQESQENTEDWETRRERLRKPLDKLRNLRSAEGETIRDASPGAILELKERARGDEDLRAAIDAATTPEPLRPELTRSLVDAWAMTSLTEHTGRPEIGPWLRGWIKDDKPQTTVIWRKHLPVRKRTLMTTKKESKEIEAFFEAAPPHATEMLETETYHVTEWLIRRTKARFGSKKTPAPNPNETSSNEALPPLQGEDVFAYILSPGRDLRSRLCGGDPSKQELEKNLPGAILVVDARFGGLSEDGMLLEKIKKEKIPRTIDDGEIWQTQPDDKRSSEPVVRFRVRSVTPKDDGSVEQDGGWRERHRFEVERSEDSDVPTRLLLVEKWRGDSQTDNDGAAGHLQELEEHHAWTECRARALAKNLGLQGYFADALTIAARLHDEGKRHLRWQQAFNAPDDGKVYAKTDGKINFAKLDSYRHEFGSLVYVACDRDFKALPAQFQDLILHLIAAHHGWARPFISTSGCDEMPSKIEECAHDVALRFARLQRQWGPWGLAWWEMLLRAADQQASRQNESRDKYLNRDSAIGGDG